MQTYQEPTRYHFMFIRTCRSLLMFKSANRKNFKSIMPVACDSVFASSYVVTGKANEVMPIASDSVCQVEPYWPIHTTTTNNHLLVCGNV